MRRKVKSRSTSGRFFVDFDMVGIVDLWLSWGDATKSVFDCASAARSSLVSLIPKHYVQDVFPTQTYCKARVLMTYRKLRDSRCLYYCGPHSLSRIALLAIPYGGLRELSFRFTFRRIAWVAVWRPAAPEKLT